MSLVSTVPETDAAVAAVPKARRQIHAYSDSSTSIVRYTVPEGRKFVGQAVGKNTGSKLYLVVEGADSTATNSEMFVGKAGESYNLWIPTTGANGRYASKTLLYTFDWD